MTPVKNRNGSDNPLGRKTLTDGRSRKAKKGLPQKRKKPLVPEVDFFGSALSDLEILADGMCGSGEPKAL
jgi:hypothetical protein